MLGPLLNVMVAVPRHSPPAGEHSFPGNSLPICCNANHFSPGTTNIGGHAERSLMRTDTFLQLDSAGASVRRRCLRGPVQLGIDDSHMKRFRHRFRGSASCPEPEPEAIILPNYIRRCCVLNKKKRVTRNGRLASRDQNRGCNHRKNYVPNPTHVRSPGLNRGSPRSR